MTRPAHASASNSTRPDLRLDRLEVRHLATISELSLELRGGFCAFTGETGAGKSIIVDALGLLMGSRANQDLIRSGEQELLVTAFWTDETSVSRKLSTQGRGAARLDGEVVSLRELQEWTQQRLTIHWQHSAVTLLSAANQRALLDGQVPEAVQAYAASFQQWREASARLDELQAKQTERRRLLDLLGYQVQEIQEADLDPAEEEPLTQELTRQANLQQISESAAGGLTLLSDGDISALGLLSEAVKALNAGAKYDETVAQLQRELREALDAVQAIVSELRAVAENPAAEPERLAQLEARLALLNKLKAKYGPSLGEVQAFGERAAQELSSLQTDEEDAGSLGAEVEALAQQVVLAGKQLDTARARAALPLAQQLLEVIRELGMPHARLEFQFRPLEAPAAQGLSEVVLMFTANPGELLAPLTESASGGELSRVMLAISTVLGAHTPSVVFDEVDAGIGGAAAQAVAAQLSRLAQHKQVLVVTHLAQIAAKADHHYRVEKTVQNGRTVTQVRLLAPQERLEEIARMLSGNTSQAALQHARELLES